MSLLYADPTENLRQTYARDINHKWYAIGGVVVMMASQADGPQAGSTRYEVG